MDEKLEMAAASQYPAHMFPVAECCHKREGFMAGAEWQKQQSPWISVKERLPCADELVLCQMGSNYAIVSGYIFINEAGNPQVATDPSFEFEDYNDYKPVKWMPIPS